MKQQICRWIRYCLDGLALLNAAGRGLAGGRWDGEVTEEVLSHD